MNNIVEFSSPNNGLLKVENLSVTFAGHGDPMLALDRVSFNVSKSEIVCLVGESGCGKSVTAMAILGLLPKHTSRIAADSITLGDTNLHMASDRTLRDIRGNRIGMVFQDTMSSLNPVHTIGMQIAEAVREHKGVSQRQALARAKEMLELVRIPDAANRLGTYPHELSGGMRQRVMIAMALACEPELLIADEPTTALDVTVQAQILELIRDLGETLGMGVILITHDLGVVAATADRMMVMYAGRVVEEGRTGDVFSRPSHGYTSGLMQSLPSHTIGDRSPLREIPGSVPRLQSSAAGCAFAPRCTVAEADCMVGSIPLTEVHNHHRTRCLHSNAVLAGVQDNEIVRLWS